MPRALHALVVYYQTLWYYWVGKGKLADCPYLKDSKHARVHLYSIALILTIWDRPHYRNGTFRDDMVKNLRNVAIPGTGIPLSLFCYYRVTAVLFILIAYPLIALASGIHTACLQRKNPSHDPWGDIIGRTFYTQLLEPQDWFSFWRLNCRLATLHSYVTQEGAYKLEDKWTFLQEAERVKVAVTPTLQEPARIVCKHRNEEGGLGFASYANAAHGGDWIIQQRLSNAKVLRDLLPDNAPLSTFRVVTMSSAMLREKGGRVRDDVVPLSCVWRAGRAGAATDHQSVLFDMDQAGSKVGPGTSSAHWYQLGVSAVRHCQLTSTHDITRHPDTNDKITGVAIPELKEVLSFSRDAHFKMAPNVPLIGWDIALSEEEGMIMLEGNFSCNFFRGTFDQKHYFATLEQFFEDLEGRIPNQKKSD